MSKTSKLPSDSRIQFCLQIVSSIGKGLAVIAAVVALYIVLMVVAFWVFWLLITGEYIEVLRRLHVVPHPSAVRASSEF